MEPTAAWDNGDMVVVWLKDRQETTLKKIYKEDGGKVRLQPANVTMDPIYVDAKEVEVQGKVLYRLGPGL
jgi:repressor LexA